MARGIHRLTAAAVSALRKRGRYADGGGLYLRVAEGGSKSWIFAYMRHGRAREMGLGSVSTFTLAEARELAREARKQLAAGIDPIDARKAERQAARLEQARQITFKAAAEAYMAEHEKGWRNDKHRTQWQRSLASYAYPTLGNLAVADVDRAAVLRAIKPLWTEKAETMNRVRGRIEIVLNWAAAHGYRPADVPNPAKWRGNLEHALPARNKVQAPQPMVAMPYAELPAFMAELRQQDSVTARALEFTILTGARTDQAIGATWSEVDLDAKVWTIPAGRMLKADKEHRVPLSDRVLDILAQLPREDRNPFIFIGGRRNGGLAQDAMRKALRTLRPDVDVHGFRSSFADWAAEKTAYPWELREMALAHTVGTAVERAYRRSDLFDKRRRLMSDWATFCASPPAKAGKVVPLRA